MQSWQLRQTALDGLLWQGSVLKMQPQACVTA